ncbi:MAG: hypothetical protein NVSMB58_35720 [Terriglobales bacterium]
MLTVRKTGSAERALHARLQVMGSSGATYLFPQESFGGKVGVEYSKELGAMLQDDECIVKLRLMLFDECNIWSLDPQNVTAQYAPVCEGSPGGSEWHEVSVPFGSRGAPAAAPNQLNFIQDRRK